MFSGPSLEVVFLRGSPLDRGRIHGEVLRGKIHDNVARWKDRLGSATGLAPDRYLAEFIEHTSFAVAIQKWTPDLWEEVLGVIQGAGLDFNSGLALQLSDEEWWYRRCLKSLQRTDSPHHCSGLGIWKRANGPPIVAQNMDLPNHYDGFQTLLRVSHENSPTECLVFTSAGQIALNGLNNHGIGVCVNALPQTRTSVDGLPVAFVVRGLLQQSTRRQAVEFLGAVKHASGQNYIIGDPDSVVDCECGADSTVEMVIPAGATYLCHTNHPLVNGDQGASANASEQRAAAELGQANSRERLDYLVARVRKLGASARLSDIQSILSSIDVPICIDRRDPAVITLGCTIMELSVTPVLSLSPGPPCETKFQTFTF